MLKLLILYRIRCIVSFIIIKDNKAIDVYICDKESFCENHCLEDNGFSSDVEIIKESI